MSLSSELILDLGGIEARNLWNFLNKHENDLDEILVALMRRLESGLWDRLSIDDMDDIPRSGEMVNE
jgi:hypothetical protein